MAHVAESKKKVVKDIEKLISENPIVGAVNMENLPAPQLQVMRGQLREKVTIIMAKRRLIKIAIENSKAKKPGIEKLVEHLRGMPALIFTKDNPFALFKTLKKSKSMAPAKAGQTAPNDIKVKAGPTSFAPGPVIGELGAIGIKCGVEDGKVAIKEESVVVKDGEKIGPKQAEILTRLGIEPMEVGLDLIATYEDGTIFTKDVLDIDEDEFNNKLSNAARWAVNLSVEAGYPTKDTIKLMIGKAFNDAKTIGLEQNIIDEGIVDELLGKAERHATSVKATANVPDAPEAEVKKEEPKVEEKPKEEVKKEEPKVEEKKPKAEEKKADVPKVVQEAKALEEEKEIIKEETKLEEKPKEELAPVEKEVKEAVKEEEEKVLEKERIDKEKEVEKIEKEKTTDDKVAEMVDKMKKSSEEKPTADQIVEEVKKESPKVEEKKEEPKKDDVPSAHDLAKKRGQAQHKTAEELTQELLKKGTLRR